MYFNDNHMISIYPIVILLFVLPLLAMAIKENIFSRFSLMALLHTVNKAVKYHVILGILSLILAFLIDLLVYTDGEGNTFTAVIIESSYAFVVIGVFIYLPGLAILNCLGWLINKVKKHV